jgi:hypothetical protein
MNIPPERDVFLVLAQLAQAAERVLGKDEVSGSSPELGSGLEWKNVDPRGRDCTAATEFWADVRSPGAILHLKEHL